MGLNITPTFSFSTSSVTSDTTPDPTGDAKINEYYITALAGAAAFNAPTGSLVNGNTLKMRIKDNGTNRALTWDGVYRASADLPLPTTTLASKTMYLFFNYNSADSKWDLTGLIANFT